MKNKYIIFVLFLLYINSYSQIWVTHTSFGRPFTGTYYLGDQINTSGSWYYQFEIGQASWNSSQVGLGQSSDGTGWVWDDAVWYQDGSGSNKKVQRNISSFRFTNIGNWFVTGRAKANAGDAYTYSDESGWNNNTVLSASASSGNCSYFVVNPLQNPTAFSYTCASENTNQIILNWSKWNTKDVIILRNTTGVFASPTQGVTYNSGDIIGDSDVLYRGNATSYTDRIVPGTTYYYKIYSENWSYYSSGQMLTAFLNNTNISPSVQTVDLYAATTNLSASVSGAVSYQWYSNNVANNYGGTAINGETNSSLILSSYIPGTYYYYLVAKTGTGTCDLVISNVSTLIVNNSNVVNWANIQFPKTEQDVYEGVGIDIFAQVYVMGSTPGIGQSSGIEAQLGYSTSDTNPNGSGWVWVNAQYNSAQSYLTDYNDEYMVLGFGNDLPQGIYYVASRFKKTGETAYVYGGTDLTNNTNSGGIWNGTTYKNLKININKTITWDGTTWNNTIGPTSYFPKAPCIIAGGTTSPPSFSTKKITINSGVSFLIPSGSYVKVKNEIINNNGNSSPETFVIEDGGNLIQDSDSVVNTSAIRVKKNTDVPLSPIAQYTFWSSPVIDQNLKTIFPGYTTTALYYNESTNYFGTSSGVYILGRGLAVKNPVSGGNPTTLTAVFNGIPFNGSVNYTMALTSGGGYNLVGNPYPSNINLKDLYLLNGGGTINATMDSTIYLWDNTNNADNSQQGSGYQGTSYANYNAASDTGSPADNNSKLPNAIASVGQGFIVKAVNSGNKILSFNNSLRKSDSGTFFKKNSDKYWIRLYTPQQKYSTVAVTYTEGADNQYDNYDSKWNGDSSDRLYSYINEQKVAIQGRAYPFINSDKFILGNKHSESGIYKISLWKTEGVFSDGQSVYLKDNYEKILTDLTKGDYSFVSDMGEFTDRFEIVYSPENLLSSNDITNVAIQIYKDRENFVVKSKNKDIRKINIYDITGRLINMIEPNKKYVEIPNTILNNGIYFVEAFLNNGLIFRKKLFK